MLKAEKHCEILSDHIRFKSQAMYDGFKLFVQMFSGILGGAIVIRLQYGKSIPVEFVGLSNALVIVVVITVSVIIVDHFRSWYFYRKALTRVAGRDRFNRYIVPPPNLSTSSFSLVTMIAVIAASAIGFVLFNPLRILS